MSRTINVAMASYGMSGMVFHAPLVHVHPHLSFAKVLERSHNRAANRYPQVTTVRTFKELLTSEIDLVIVNTPDHLHFEMAKAALEAGKHVVVEKPFTVTVAEGEELMALAQQKGVLLSVFQNRRWDGDFMTVQKLTESQLLGELAEFESHFDRFRNYIQPGTWKEQGNTGTGSLYNLGSHLIDQALVLFGKPEALTADLAVTRSGGKVTDYFNVILHYGGSFRAILKSGYLVRQAGPRFALHGHEGSFIKHGLDPQEDALKAGQLPLDQSWGSDPESQWGTLATTVSGMDINGKITTLNGDYRKYYNNVYRAITSGTELAVKPAESLAGIKIIEAAAKSHAQGKTVALDL